MKETAALIKKAVKGAKSALIVSHVDPDGDSIGSMLALGMLLIKMRISVDYYSQDGVPRVYKFLPGAEKIENSVALGRYYDILFAVDASDVSRLGEKNSPRDVARFIINIDHHPDNTKFGDINHVEKCSSTAELIYKLAREWKIGLDKEMAENLYVALITDTGNYRYENTSAATFAMAGALLETGLDTHEITTRIYDNKSLASIRVQAAVLATLETSPDRKVAWAMVTHEMMQKTEAKGEDLVGLVDQIRSIESVEVAILFREEDGGKVKVNFRAKYAINVSKIAKAFGGGGHIKAAGAVINGHLQEVKDRVVAEALKYIEAAKYLV